MRERTARGPCEFTLLVPVAPDVPAAEDQTRTALEFALPLLGEAAGGR